MRPISKLPADAIRPTTPETPHPLQCAPSNVGANFIKINFFYKTLALAEYIFILFAAPNDTEKKIEITARHF